MNCKNEVKINIERGSFFNEENCKTTDFILALDFDGTLYPIIEHDSEQMLALKVKRDDSDSEIDSFIESDKRGALSPAEFNNILLSHLKGHDIAIIDSVIDDILSSFDIKKLDPLIEVAKMENVHLAILSCGTDLLIKAFLEKAGLKEHNEHILSKELVVEDGRFDRYIYHVTHISDKAKEIRKLREKYKGSVVIAVGDGPTDIPMLEEADYPFIIKWRDSDRAFPFPIINNFEPVKELIEKI